MPLRLLCRKSMAKHLESEELFTLTKQVRCRLPRYRVMWMHDVDA